jgi:hypothetical protein
MTCKLYKSFRRIRNKGKSFCVIQVDDLGKMKRGGRREIVRIRNPLEGESTVEKKARKICKCNFINVFV